MEQLELISICLAELEDSPSRADGQESKPSHSAKSKNTLSESCEKTSQEFGYSKTFGSFQQLNFASLSCLPEATRASLSAKPGSAEARKMTATSGLRCLELSEHQGRLGYLLKTLLGMSRWASTKCLLTWKAKTTPSNRLLFQLAPWTPRTDEIEFGFWATPNATPRGATLETQGVRSLLPTPTADCASSRSKKYKQGGTPLQVAAMLIPTPTANCYKGARKAETLKKTKRNPLTNSIMDYVENQNPNTTNMTTGALNPTWVEWLMGYPEGWTDCEDSETQSYRKSHTKSSKH